MSTPVILKLDAGGLPVGWIHWQTAVTLYARKRVCWEAGEERFAITGGINARTGERSYFEIGSIIAVADRSRRYTHGVPMLTNRTLFQRDHNLCLYCGEQYNPTQLTRDHVMPASRGGETTWLNCVTACKLTPPEALLVRGSASRTSINYCDVMNARTSVSNQFKSRVH